MPDTMLPSSTPPPAAAKPESRSRRARWTSPARWWASSTTPRNRGELILRTIGDTLRERHGVARIVTRRKEHYSKPATADIIDEMAKEVQVAIAAVGG